MNYQKVVPGRLELPTSTLSVWRSNQLSYRTGIGVVSALDGKASARLRLSHIIYRITSVTRVRIHKISEPSHSPRPPCIPRRMSPERRCSLTYLACACATAELRLSTAFSRKEVFQPHLPVRLPCYDLAPITSFTLGRPSRLRTSGTPGFHGLTGGVYKARERIHRAMADARLLANPASWSRVADSSPN